MTLLWNEWVNENLEHFQEIMPRYVAQTHIMQSLKTQLVA